MYTVCTVQAACPVKLCHNIATTLKGKGRRWGTVLYIQMLVTLIAVSRQHEIPESGDVAYKKNEGQKAMQQLIISKVLACFVAKSLHCKLCRVN